MPGRSLALLAGLASSLVLSSALAGGNRATAPVALPVEPQAADLPPVDPAWRAKGWRAVVPHAFVLKRLLPVRAQPKATAPAVFWLKGGTRVPVVEQGYEWWRVRWTEGRSGWVRARDLEPHASFVLIEASTGRVIWCMAAKGRWGAVSDGTHLWSLANTGLTRTTLGDRPVIWSRQVAGDRDADFPAWSVWNSERTAFLIRADGPEEGVVLRGEVASGSVRILGRPAPGELLGATPEDRLLVTSYSSAGGETRLFDPGRQGVIRRVPAATAAMTAAGLTFLLRGNELIRSSPDLRAAFRTRLPAEIQSVCLSGDEKYVAASYWEWAPGKEEDVTRVRVFRADRLQPVATLTMPGGLYPEEVGSWTGGWWLRSSADGGGVHLARFRRSGALLTEHEGFRNGVVSPDGSTAYLTDENAVLAVSTATGKVRRFPFTWRRRLPARYLPNPSEPGFPTHLEVSSLTVSPDGKMLILTEWLNGDPAG